MNSAVERVRALKDELIADYHAKIAESDQARSEAQEIAKVLRAEFGLKSIPKAPAKKRYPKHKFGSGRARSENPLKPGWDKPMMLVEQPPLTPERRKQKEQKLAALLRKIERRRSKPAFDADEMAGLEDEVKQLQIDLGLVREAS